MPQVSGQELIELSVMNKLGRRWIIFKSLRLDNGLSNEYLSAALILLAIRALPYSSASHRESIVSYCLM